MNTQFLTHGLNPNASSRARLEKLLPRSHNLVPETAADLVLKRHWENATAFRTQIHLAVPGPDIRAEAPDCTLKTVWLKISTALRKQIERRKPGNISGGRATACVR